MKNENFITNIQLRSFTIGLLFVMTCGCVSSNNSQNNSSQDNNQKKYVVQTSDTHVKRLEQGLKSILDTHQINTAGIAIINNGEVTWQGYFGQQSTEVPASASTLFNVASITKTVTAETVLRLVNEGKLSLDESMANYWIDPDLKDDPEVHKLTPRMALTHTTGFPNWRFSEKDGKLKFKNKPGTTFGYSGEGIQYLAKFLEKKLAQSFEEIVRATIFAPLNIHSASISVRETNFSRIAKPLDKNGKFHGFYCYPGGYCRKEASYSAAGDMVITVKDYANFMIATMASSNINQELVRDRSKIQGIEVTPKDVDCSQSKEALCPIKMGYGLGWNVTELSDETVIGHRGSDWSMVSLAYYYSGSKDGLVIFFNAPNKSGIAAMVDTLELLDPKSPEVHGYMFRRARAN